MPIAITKDQAREVDRRAIQECGMSGLVLMENAGRGAADLLCRLIERGDFPDSSGRHRAPCSPARPGPKDATGAPPGDLTSTPHVLICCGKGNNAGDGFVIARHLDLRGYLVQVLVWAEEAELTGDAGTNFQILRHCGVPIELFGSRHDAARLQEELARADWAVDALLGTGARGEPRPPLDSVIDQINAAHVKRLAVDLPSGLDCDSGAAAAHTILADETCTFVAMKRGFLAAGAERYIGRVHVLDIGAPRRLVEAVASS